MKAMKMKDIFAGIALGLSLCATPSLAQSDVTRVNAERQWSVFATEGSNKECWIASGPQTSTASRNGSSVTVRRGDVRLMVTNRPASNVRNEISFTGGYPFRDGSNVRVSIGSNTFELYTNGEWAWPSSPADDVRLVSAMRAGAEARVVGVSSRGTTTTDTVSLVGFTAALEDANRRCTE